MNNKNDSTLQYLLDLDGEKIFIDEKLGVWVKFEVKETSPNIRTSGIRYSLTLHDRTGDRVLGFDNAHLVEYGGKNQVAPKRTFDHCHIDGKKNIKPYPYINAGKLLEDFWEAVELKIKDLKEGI